MNLYKIKPVEWHDEYANGIRFNYSYRPEHSKYRLTISPRPHEASRNTLLDFDTVDELKQFVDAHNEQTAHVFLELVHHESTHPA
ncbi:hypothetical protein [Moraxella marmotae]|uniref:hypothetical protein n=1 Tax=Moraxella marmotae TaxID=3344520 RepID=UPI0035D524E3